ncbi:MAG: matrixin family metalloprotease [Cyanobacteria bacterium HKST-UBA04]|nr:matrixin family metalloprotease [Cyanobacteria bacterium HKST-UBA04]MCA9841148.1 matrixin family metalloprotease [Cyanobacteria bacterium HKST-UBA03]
MSNRTYLQPCLFQDQIVRWPDGAMPIRVYIAPFHWYEQSKQQEANLYRQLVLSAFQVWSQATGNKVRFQYVTEYRDSQIDVKWRRINRRSLGETHYEHDAQGRMFSCTIEIGITDGLTHARYEDTNEVSHTIIHEVGHALGLIDHSEDPRDIMYVPHQYGVHTISPRDAETMNWLYSLPVGFNYKVAAKQYGINKSGFTINDLIDALQAKITGKPVDSGNDASVPEAPAPAPASGYPANQPHILKTSSLDEHHEILSQMGRFNIHTQNIKLTRQDTVALNPQRPTPIGQPRPMPRRGTPRHPDEVSGGEG